MQWHHSYAGTLSLLEEEELNGAVQLPSEGVAPPDGVGGGTVQLVPVPGHLPIRNPMAWPVGQYRYQALLRPATSNIVLRLQDRCLLANVALRPHQGQLT